MTTIEQKKSGEPDGILFVDAEWSVRQTYIGDPILDRFFTAIVRERRLMGGVVAGTDRVIFPPASFCEETYQAVRVLTPVGPGGTIRAATEAQTKFPNGPNPPWIMAFVQLDGASTATPAYLRGEGLDGKSMVELVGKRCRAVIKDPPQGGWDDFWFELQGDAA